MNPLSRLMIRYSQEPSSLTPIQTLTILDVSLVALRWSVEQTTSSHSKSSWESSTLFYSWCASVYTTPQLNDPLLRSCCNS